MNAPQCKARVPESCRYHGLGKDLPESIYAKVVESLEQTNKNIHIWNSTQPDDFLIQIERNQASYVWKRAIKQHKQDLRTQELTNRSIPLLENPITVEDKIYNSAAKVFNEATEINIYSASQATIPLKLVSNARYAKNNCAIVTKAILNNIDAKEFESEQPLKSIRIDAPDTKDIDKTWHHAAFIVTKNNEEYVVDYTIRQFDKTLSIPHVSKKNVWLNKINEITGENWSEKPLKNWSITSGETRASLSMKLIP